MATFRRLLFWTHLACGLVAGVVIAIMSFTGVAIAFEQEILAWVDRDVARVTVPAGATARPLAELNAAVAAAHPDFKATTIVVPRDPAAAYTYRAGREATLYVNPYTGAIATPRSGPAHDVLHELEDWHRWLGRDGDGRAAGRLVTGVCNLAFLGLCVTGLYLWFPRAWSRRALRPLLWFVRGAQGKARDFNWHNVIGLWSAPVLIVLTATGVVISFPWAHNLVFRAVGDEPPKSRDFRMMAVPPPPVPAPAAGAQPLGADALFAAAIRARPDWESVGLNLPPKPDPAKPADVVVFTPAPFATAGRVQLHLDPFRGDVLRATTFADRSPGLRARVWMRFLHTGEAFGLPGKIIAALATAASLVLVYTGFALSWRRFFPRRDLGQGG
ncbi:MAG: PepSY domain-containing protein [Opitutaceae bacterium]|nr:PepSY domain-containing protein [Opitutaceae bacterium]